MGVTQIEILIVEDSEEMVWSMSNVLEKAGFSVDAVMTGEEAIERLNEFPNTAVVVLNYLLPDMSGLSAMRKFRENGCAAEVIAISAFEGSREHFLKDGVFAFLEKPFDINELVNLCRQALNRRNTLTGDSS